MPSPFVEELERLLKERGLSWRKLAELLGYTPGWLSKIRHGAPPSPDMVRRCDELLAAGGALIALAEERAHRPAELPPAPVNFIGRKAELLSVEQELSGSGRAGVPAIVTIEGPPGVGKTALALRCAHDAVRRGNNAFPDGQLYADLCGYSSDSRPVHSGSVLEEFLSSLGVPAGEIPAKVEQRAKTYRSILARKRVLVVLDNAVSSEQIEMLLPASPECAVIVTSRRRLSGLLMKTDARRVVLAPMREDESALLLRTVVGESRVAADPAAVSALARECGYLPLALRIAAERLTADPNVSVRELVQDLAVSEQRLDYLVTDDSPSVRRIFEYSYRDLSEDVGRMFRLIGLHRGAHVSVNAAAALVGKPVGQARLLIEQLVNVHLLEAVPGNQYRFHDLIRSYAIERSTAEESAGDREAAVRRLTDWYLYTAVAGGRVLAPYRIDPLVPHPHEPGVSPLTFADDEMALRWYDAESPNFVPVIELATGHGLYDAAWQLAAALWHYLRLLRKPMSLWIASYRLARDAARATGNRYAEAWMETNLAEGYRWSERYERSQELYEHALAVREEIGDRHGRPWTLLGCGFLAVDRGRPEEAYEYAQRALAMFREIDDRHGQGSALFTLSDAYVGWRRYGDALGVLQDSFQIFDQIGDFHGQGVALVKMGELSLLRGENEGALSYFARSLAAYRTAGSRLDEADSLSRKANVLFSLGRAAEARECWEAASALYRQLDDPRAADVQARLQACP